MEEVTQDARCCPDMLSEIFLGFFFFSIWARWRGLCRHGREFSSARAESLARNMKEFPSKSWKTLEWWHTLSFVPCFVRPRSLSGNGHVQAEGEAAPSPPPPSLFPWAVLGSGSHSLRVSNWFLRDCRPLSSNYEPSFLFLFLFLPFWNIKGDAERNRLELMKVIWSFVTAGWTEGSKSASNSELRDAVSHRPTHWSKMCRANIYLLTVAC